MIYKTSSERLKEIPTQKLLSIITNKPEGATRWYNGRYFKVSGRFTYWYSTYVNKWIQESRFVECCPHWNVALTMRDLKKEFKTRVVKDSNPNPNPNCFH